MPTRYLPQQSDLRHLKLQAKSLLKDCLSGQSEAQARLSRWSSKPGTATLSKAQTTIAREYGARSWPNLVARVEALKYVYPPPGRTPPVPPDSMLPLIVELMPQHSWTCGQALIRAGRAGIDAAIKGLQHRSPQIRYQCAGFFDHHRDPRGIEALREHTNDPVPRVRRNVVHSIGCERCAGAPLVADHVKVVEAVCLNDANFKVQREAVRLLGEQSGDMSARQTLHILLGRELAPKLRRMALNGLSIHGRACFARKTEVELRAMLGEPHHVLENAPNAPPRLLFFTLAALTGVTTPNVSPPVWLQFIIKHGSVANVSVVE